jgi:hypothetical protein
MEWLEKLPPNCPPDKAEVPNNDTFYRLIKNISPNIENFYSQRQLFPDRTFNVDECRARSVSIFKELIDCKGIKKLPLHKNSYIIKILLSSESGLILKTGRADESHYSWWLYKNFNPIPSCKLVDE